MLKPICRACHCFFRPLKNGLVFLEGKPKRNSAPRGLAAPDLWEPYKLWSGDLWECPSCSTEIIVGTGREPISQDYFPDFEQKVRDYNAVFQVNDC